MIRTTLDNLKDSDIRDLQKWAGQAGDLEQVRICRVACGDEETASQTEINEARLTCLEVIQLVEANEEDQ